MALNFPSNPTTGQKYPAPPQPGIPTYAWDGEKWTTIATTGSAVSAPSNNDPARNGIAAPGGSDNYSRGDHRHPTDTTRAPFNNPVFTGTLTASSFECPGNAALGAATASYLNISGASSFGSLSASSMTLSGNLTVTGKIISLVNSHRLGSASGAPVPGTPPALTDANVVFYSGAAGNWCGLGTDTNGTFWIRTGLSGTPTAAFTIDTNQVANFQKSPIAPTAAAGDNTNRLATTAFVRANPASGAFLPLSGGTIDGNLTVNPGDYHVHRGNNTGVIFLDSTPSRYLYFDGTNFNLPTSAVYNANGMLWGGGNFGWPASNARLAYYGDRAHGYNEGLVEPWSGCIITGQSGTAYNGYNPIFRYRAMQLLTSSWWTIGYA
jgi:hypothetical protein